MVMSMPHRTVPIDGLDVFYREAGDPSAPTLVLLHGFPTSPAAYQELMAALSGEFHLAAPGYPSFGHSSARRRRVGVHLRPARRRGGPTARRHRRHQVRDLRARLRRTGRLPPRTAPP
ncbi:alpha/beta hydrolase fold [[Actinomadura] parvosata subsp. kistnae]|nr:alpha/beta hydrolase fold [Actinomadura parvosata subsp. kistnae]